MERSSHRVQKRYYSLTIIVSIVFLYLYLRASAFTARPVRHSDGLSKEYRDLFATNAVNNTLVIVPVNTGMLNWAENLLCSLQSTGFNTSSLIFWALDAAAESTLKAQGRLTYRNAELFATGENENRHGDTRAYKRMMRERPKFYIDVLASGFDILMLDADTVFWQSPLSIVPAGGSEARDGVDIVYSTDSREFYQVHNAFEDERRRGAYVPPICNGIFWMKSSKETIALWREMLDTWEDWWFETPFGRKDFQDDQRAMDVLLNDGRARVVAPFPDGIEKETVPVPPGARLGVRLLDQTQVVNGHLLMNRNNVYEEYLGGLRREGGDRIAAHFNWWTVEVSKEEGAKQLGMMFVDEKGECHPNGTPRLANGTGHGNGYEEKKRLHLTAFMRPVSLHTGAWRYPESYPDANFNFNHLKSFIQKLESAKFDAFFMADHLAVLNMPLEALKRSHTTTSFEPFTLLSALSQCTSKIGLAATASTTYDEPYHIARRFASLDHISNGRAAWNIVTTGNPESAKNFGQEEHREHGDRYRRAREFYDVVTGLWDSFADDAFVRDRESGIYLNPDRMHVLGHKGEQLNVRGPLNIARPVQGWPVIVQAGQSDPGKQLAAETAELVFCSPGNLARAKELYSDIKSRTQAAGRSRDHIKILPAAMIIVGDNWEDAQRKRLELDSLVHYDSAIAQLSISLGTDASVFDPDAPLPKNLPETNASKTGREGVIQLAAEENLTVRQIAQRYGGFWGLAFLGSPEKIADDMQQWLDEEACDGFTCVMPYLPQGLDDVVQKLVPVLQERGLFRKEYEGNTLREHLGLPRPGNKFFEGNKTGIRAVTGEETDEKKTNGVVPAVAINGAPVNEAPMKGIQKAAEGENGHLNSTGQDWILEATR
ncbi:Histidine--tRNA ligase [Lecanosticta acicola]|uniref:Histidine--tRNA ligase n=1 Tax=Lecanosticta acicola TaxID=111012 RepID=A0AAI8YVI9_9PEZI|nr:Histidine--tRNA ligase [Lecanosticta acicola]